VGPYDTVQLQSTNPTALSDWLTANGFAIPADVQPIIAAYVQEGFDFLALKLQPGQGVQAMRPVRVTSSGASLSLPLRMVSAGTGATVGITLWVVSQGRYEAANFPNFTINPSSLVWDWNLETSNYTTLQQQAESAANFATWQTESSLDISPYQVENSVLADDASNDYLPIPESDAGDGGAGETADQVRQDDLAAVFPSSSSQGTVRITRMRADLAHAALANDLTLQASSDQSNVSNIYQVTQSINAPACPAIPNPCPPCSGSSGGSSGGTVGSQGGGTTTGPAQPGQQSFGCSAVPSEEHGGAWLELSLAGLLGLSVVRARRRRNKAAR
jgi:MYXO-CTERM domain-containing protein